MSWINKFNEALLFYGIDPDEYLNPESGNPFYRGSDNVIKYRVVLPAEFETTRINQLNEIIRSQQEEIKSLKLELLEKSAF